MVLGTRNVLRTVSVRNTLGALKVNVSDTPEVAIPPALIVGRTVGGGLDSNLLYRSGIYGCDILSGRRGLDAGGICHPHLCRYCGASVLCGVV